jgi:radical SAM superfamily enzyme YgiQ (UPF0313 family)
VSLFLCVIPKHSVNVPPLSLGFLQGACKKHGVDVQIRDFNFDIWQKTIHTEKWHNIWLETNQTLFKGEEFKKFCDEIYDNEIQNWAQEIAATKHSHVGISCFSHRSLPTFRKLAIALRKLAPEKIIIAGGAPMTQYGKFIIDSGLADYAVLSEGEQVLPDIVKGKYEPGIIETQQIDNLDDLAIPDYTGLDVTQYTGGSPVGDQVRDPKYKKRNELAIIGSRGCVRKCTFCDVEAYWPKFRWRSAQNIFDEMMHYKETYGIDRFFFYDSLVNGNTKQFEELLDLIIEAGSPFKGMQGLAIFKRMPERVFEKMRKARWHSMIVGVESFSEEVRDHMRKKFSNKIMHENLEYYKKYKIKLVLLMIVGYPGELEKHHKENYQWMKNNRQFAGNPIKQIEVGTTMLVFPGSPVFYENMFEYYVDDNGDWVVIHNNEINNMQVRTARRDDLVKWAKEFGLGTNSVYGTGGQLVGDVEERDIVNKIHKLEHSTDLKLEDEYVKQSLGWESDPTRPTHNYWLTNL